MYGRWRGGGLGGELYRGLTIIVVAPHLSFHGHTNTLYISQLMHALCLTVAVYR